LLNPQVSDSVLACGSALLRWVAKLDEPLQSRLGPCRGDASGYENE